MDIACTTQGIRMPGGSVIEPSAVLAANTDPLQPKLRTLSKSDKYKTVPSEKGQASSPK